MKEYFVRKKLYTPCIYVHTHLQLYVRIYTHAHRGIIASCMFCHNYTRCNISVMNQGDFQETYPHTLHD